MPTTGLIEHVGLGLLRALWNASATVVLTRTATLGFLVALGPAMRFGKVDIRAVVGTVLGFADSCGIVKLFRCTPTLPRVQPAVVGRIAIALGGRVGAVVVGSTSGSWDRDWGGDGDNNGDGDGDGDGDDGTFWVVVCSTKPA